MSCLIFVRFLEHSAQETNAKASRNRSPTLRKKRSILPRPLPIPQLTRPTTTGEAATLPALAVDAVADVDSLWCVDHSNDLQLNARGQHLEEHRDQVDLHLIEHPGTERPLRRGRAMHQHVAVSAAALTCVIAASIPSVT
jgi:hypothetical protein